MSFRRFGTRSLVAGRIRAASPAYRPVAHLYGSTPQQDAFRFYVTGVCRPSPHESARSRIPRMNELPLLLVVDDDASVRAMLREYLEGHGFAVAEAGSGGEMRERIGQQLPRAVLLDLRLPDEDGLVLARYLREHHDVGIL